MSKRPLACSTISSGTSSRSGPTRRTWPAGSSRRSVTGPDFTHDAADALAYNFPVTGNGWNSGDLTTMAGGAGWHMSVDELLRVMAAFRRAVPSSAPSKRRPSWTTASASTGRYRLRSGATTPRSGVRWYTPAPVRRSSAWRSSSCLIGSCVVLVNSPVGPPNQFLYTVWPDAYAAHIEERATAASGSSCPRARSSVDARGGVDRRSGRRPRGRPADCRSRDRTRLRPPAAAGGTSLGGGYCPRLAHPGPVRPHRTHLSRMLPCPSRPDGANFGRIAHSSHM